MTFNISLPASGGAVVDLGTYMCAFSDNTCVTLVTD